MKKLLLKIMLCATACLALVGFIPTAIASAETAENSAISVETENVSAKEETSENQAEIVEETESTKWFDETIKPLLIQYGTEVGAFATIFFILLKDLNKTKDSLGGALCALTQSNSDNRNTMNAVIDFKEAVRAEIDEMKNAFNAALQEIREGLSKEVTDIDNTVHKILDVEKIAYSSNASLVSSGAAKKIAEVVRYGENKQEEKAEPKA